MKRAVRTLVFVWLAVFAGFAASANWVATGIVNYRDREFDQTGFTGVEPLLPARFVDVQIVDASTSVVIGSGASTATGSFSIAVTDSATRSVYARALTSSTSTSDLFLKVTNTGSSVYSIATTTITGHTSTTNVNFGTFFADIGAGGEAFNLFDQGVYGMDYLAFLQGARPGSSHAYTIVWQINAGNGGSTTSGSITDMRDTGGYDDTVEAHEFGHYAVNNFSATSTPGGSHSLSDCKQDARLAWEEGHASYFGGATRRHFGFHHPNVYVRTDGSPGAGHVVLWFDLETESQYSCSGDTSEVTVFTALWDITDGPSTDDFTPGMDDDPVDTLALPDSTHWRVMTNGLPGHSYITAEDYWDAWFAAPISNGNYTRMKSIFSNGTRINFYPDAYEPNDTRSAANSIPADGSLIHLTFFTDLDGDHSGGGITDVDWFSFSAKRGWPYTVETLNLLSGCDTLLTIYNSGGTQLVSNDNRASGDPSSLISNWTPTSSGTYYVKVSRQGSNIQYGSYDLRITPTCANTPASDGAACSNGNACTTGDTCQMGACTPGTVTVCTASDQCHVAGTCDAGTGVCSDPLASVGAACSDGNACTTGDACTSGVCLPGTATVCTALDQCHVAGTCAPATGTCSNPNTANGTSCSDGNACTTGDTCQMGVCTPGTATVCTASDQCHTAGTCDHASGTCSNPTVCTALDQCHDVGTCDLSTGTCSNPAKPDGTTCSDGNACTETDSCQSGECTGSNPVVCSASDPCHVAGICDPANGTCSNPAAADGTACNDGNACTQTDSCQSGVCTGSNPVICSASDQCHVAGTCDPANGTCSNPAAADGTACSDGNACTQSDSCLAGTCVGSNPVVCTASDACHAAGTCDPASGTCSNPTVCTALDQCHDIGTCDLATGTCSNPAKPDGASCSDGNACTQTDSCQSGACTGSNPVVCSASDPCHVAGTCDPATGSCSNPTASNGTACSDGNACTYGDVCTGGACGGTPITCTDDPCNTLACNGTNACTVTPTADGTACEDGNACTVGDACGGGSCRPGAATLNCDDGNPCTDDACNPASGCVYAANTVPCDDGNPCTQGDTCGGGVCNSGTPITAPPETQDFTAAADKATYSWSAATYATQYDVVRGSTGALPVGPGGGDEVCFDNLAGTTLNDPAIPAPGKGFWYLSRGENICGIGTFGDQSDGSPRTTTTCP